MRFVKIIFSSLLFFICSSIHVNANVGVSTYRLYLDSEQSSENFIITNRLNASQKCSLGINHYTFDQQGEMGNYDGDVLPQYAAEKLMRFSPKNFTIPAKKAQTVRFSLRRKKGTDNIEHRAFLSVRCKEELPKNNDTIKDSDELIRLSFSPVLEHNIPLIVRPQRLMATAEFANVKMHKALLTFDLKRTGKRSLIGKVQLIDKNSGELLTESKQFVIYIETTRKSFELDVDAEYRLKDIMIKFIEDTNYGGTVTQTWSAK